MGANLKMMTVVFLASVGIACRCSAAYLWEDFNALAVGTNLAQLAGWDTSGSSALVTNNIYGKGSTDHVAAVMETNLAVNTVMSGQTGKVWTECLLNEETRTIPESLPAVAVDATATLMAGVTTNGYAVVYNPALGGWDICTNDARGRAIASGLASGVWARVSVFQDYQAHRVSVFLDGRLVRQNMGFISNRDDCVSISVRAGGPNTAFLDDALVTNAIPAALLGPVSSTNDINGDGTPDAQELMTYGVIAVCVTGEYSSITAALAANPPAGRIVVTPGSHAEALVFSNATTLIGSVLTNLTSLTVATGQVGVLSGITNFGCGALTIGTNASLSLSGGTATVSTLVIQSGGTVQVANGTLIVDGLILSGTFTLDSGWGGAITVQSLNYTNDFEAYPVGMPLNRCGRQGWGASSAASLVTNVHAGARAAMVAADSVLSNTVNGAVGKVWTDLYVKDPGSRPHEGLYPPLDASQAVMFFIQSNNYVTIWNAGAWDVCSNDVTGAGRPAELAISTGQWGRVTLCQDMSSTNLALFVNGILVRQKVPFIASSVSSYNHFVVEAQGDISGYVDDVRIWHTPPADLTADTDGDSIPDAAEIQDCGDTTLLPRGSVFKIR